MKQKKVLDIDENIYEKNAMFGQRFKLYYIILFLIMLRGIS